MLSIVYNDFYPSYTKPPITPPPGHRGSPLKFVLGTGRCFRSLDLFGLLDPPICIGKHIPSGDSALSQHIRKWSLPSIKSTISPIYFMLIPILSSGSGQTSTDFINSSQGGRILKCSHRVHRIPCLIHGTLKGEGVVWGIYFFAQLGNIIIEYVLKYNFKAYSSISKIVTYFHAYV